MTIYLLAIINPVSKVFILSVIVPEEHDEKLKSIAGKASLVAFLILSLMAVVGNIVLNRIFQVELFSLKVAGGIVLFYIGFQALTKGVFFEVCDHQSLEVMSIVPLASPLIAGPATITAVISFGVQYGPKVTMMALSLAVLMNLLIMLSARFVGRFLISHNIMGALIRLTGLLVATIAVDMALDGLIDWFALL